MFWPFALIFALVWLPSCGLLWYAMRAVHRTSDVASRFHAAERHDNHHQVQKLIEKLYASDQVTMATQHGNERINTMGLDARKDLEAMRHAARGNSAGVAMSNNMGSDEQYTDEAGAVHQ